ncbi:DUF3592 domain-containing protein [Amycolatopsis sp. NPDC049691]|uniref:DUF3592 domain-containing protein n=1 Tax=Amycolatopsis sp. NPDC049691 TaxID=3155155 RepID=UPI00344AEE79
MSEPVPVTWVRGRRPPRPRKPRRRGLRGRTGAGITAAGLVLALAVAAGAFAVQRYESHMRESGVEAVATVENILVFRSARNLEVSFTTATGREVTTRLDDFPRDPAPEIGDRLTIRYDPDRPDVTLWDVREPPDFTGATVFLVCLSAVLAAASIVFFCFTRRHSRKR